MCFIVFHKCVAAIIFYVCAFVVFYEYTLAVYVYVCERRVDQQMGEQSR